MQITSENGFEIDGSYEKLWQKQKNMRKKDNFWAISFVKLIILKVVAAPQKCLKTLEFFFELVLGTDTAKCEI